MATPENTFIGSVHRHLPAGIYSMKNHNQYNGGIPDVWYSGPTGDLWIEYKFIVIPKRDDTPINVNLSELQKDWLAARHDEGRRVGVIVGSKNGGVWMPGTVWQIPHTAKSFSAAMVGRPGLATIINHLTNGG